MTTPPKLARRCPNCGSRLRLLPIIYGCPSPETLEAAERGELILGGCMPESVKQACAVCHLPPKPPPLPPVDPDWPWDTDFAEAWNAGAIIRAMQRIAGGVWGHLVGDAIGVPYEFGHHIETVELRGHGTHNQAPGTWSDDGALMLALLDSLTNVGFDPDDQARRFLAWTDAGAYAPGGVVFDIGGATARALDRLRRGVPAIDAGGTDEHDNGNGSLMRILPLAFRGDGADAPTPVERAHLASRVTHGTLRCQVTCALYVLLARELLAHPTNDRAAAFEASVERLREAYVGRPEYASVHEELLTHRSRVRLGRTYVLDTFWSAWEAFAGADDYRSTVVRAVQYGHDTDTTAAIAGGLAGIHWGLGGIPPEWLGALRGKEIVEPILKRLTPAT